MENLEILKDFKIEAEAFVADKCYDSILIMERLKRVLEVE